MHKMLELSLVGRTANKSELSAIIRIQSSDEVGNDKQQEYMLDNSPIPS
jgi:hypothetical protein